MKKSVFLSFMIAFALGLLSPFGKVWASVDFRDGIYPELATSSRALAMGNAYVAKADDASSAFYNPAGLGSVRRASFHLSNFQMEVNEDWIDLGTGSGGEKPFSNFIKAFSIDGTRKLLREHPGKFSHSRAHAMPNFTARFFSFGYLYSVQTRAAYGTQTSALFEYAKRIDQGPYMGLNASLWGGVFKIGLSGIYLTRKELYGQSDIETPLEVSNSSYRKGEALIFTGGMKLSFPMKGLPTFALKMNNFSSKRFHASKNYGGRPGKIKKSLDGGFSLTPHLGKTTRMHFEVNFRDINREYRSLKTSRKIGAGVEFDFKRTIFLRLGHGDGLFSGGFGIRTRKAQFDFSTYGVDLTDSDFQGGEDRRFVLSLSSAL